MKDCKYLLAGVCEAALVIFAMLLLPVVVGAQSGNRNQAPPAPGSPKPGDELRPASIRERQFKMMEIEREAAQPPRPREQHIAFAQIAEDYREIQVINNKMMSRAMSATAPNFLGLPQTLADIRKRAIRLKENLGFPELDSKDVAKGKYKPSQNVADLKTNLLALDDSIMRFVKSPIFKNPEVVDVKEAAKTREEVEFIIKTSQLISKDAERLNKSSLKKE